MKKVILTLTGVFMFYSCSKDSEVENINLKTLGTISTDIRYKSEQFNIVGQVHNRVLDKTYDYLYTDHNDIRDEAQLKEILNQFYVEELNNTERGSNFIPTVVENNFVNLIDFHNIVFSNPEINAASEGASEKLSPYLDLLENAMDNLSISSIQEIERSVYYRPELNNKDLFIFYNMSSVAKYSISYWYTNNDKWIDLILTINNSAAVRGYIENEDSDDSSKYSTLAWPPNKGWGKEVLKQDAMGAGAGAVYAWWVNAAPGAGQIAYGTAIGATSASFSAASLIDQLWPWGYQTTIDNKNMIPAFSDTIEDFVQLEY